MKQKAAAAASKRVVKMGSYGSGAATGISSPVCCAFSADGSHRFVTDQLNNRIKIMCCKGGPVGSFGSVGRGDGEFVLPGGVSTALGLVFVADTNSSRVSVWTASRKFCCSFGERVVRRQV
jgi:DNA-binding beta-propeller fold protein YncE